MAISKVLTDTTLDSGAGGNITVTMPTSLLATDVCVLTVGAGKAGGTCGSYNTPTGWAKVGEVIDALNGNSHITIQVYVAVGTPGGLTFTAAGSISTKGYVCSAFRGVDNVTPIDASGTANSSTSAATLTTNAVTVATDQAWWVVGAADWLGGTFSAPGFTVSENAAANESAAVLYNTTPVGTGSTGTKVVTSSAGTALQVIAAVPFALRPAASGAAAPQGWQPAYPDQTGTPLRLVAF